MDKLTKSYRTDQIAGINNGDFKYLPTIKISGGNGGQTKCMDISKDEYEKICNILTDK